MHSILIIDDDEKLATPLKEYFRRFNLDLCAAAHPDMGLEYLANGDYDLVILDVMLPDKDGFDVCKLIRDDSDIPIVMLTARGEVTDRVVGLELGADDYLAKPFEPRELVARIHNILKRSDSSNKASPVLEFEDLTIDTSRQQVLVCEQAVSLTTNEYQLLVILATHCGQQLSRDKISRELRGADVDLFSRAVDIQISRLRQKLKPTDYIKTIRSAGYQFIAPTN